jgi:hypothetical protein
MACFAASIEVNHKGNVPGLQAVFPCDPPLDHLGCGIVPMVYCEERGVPAREKGFDDQVPAFSL